MDWKNLISNAKERITESAIASLKDKAKKLLVDNKEDEAIKLLLDIAKEIGDKKSYNEIAANALSLENIRRLSESDLLGKLEAGREVKSILFALLNIADNIKFSELNEKENEIRKIENKFSDNINDSLQKINNFWLTGLAFSFIGLLMIIFSRYLANPSFVNISFFLGVILIISSFALFLGIQLKGGKKISKSFSDNQDMINQLQQISLDLSRSTRTATIYAAKNINNINELIAVSIPTLSKLGLVNESNQQKFENTQKFIVSTLEYSEEIEKAIKELEKALIEADTNKMAEFSLKARQLFERIKEVNSQ
jgi:hypothetical protein